LVSGRRDVSSDVYWPNAHFEADGAHPSADPAQAPYAYGNLFLYEYNLDRLWRIDGPSGVDASGHLQVKMTLLSAPRAG
jgi:hypothetical protein